MSSTARVTTRMNTQKILAAEKRAKIAVLRRMGAFIRRTMMQSMRRRKKAARPGKPPSVHSRKPNLKTIFFVYDPATQTLIVGPVALRRRATDKPASQVQEHGGTVRIKKTRQLIDIDPHPFSRPAMEKELPNFPELMVGAISG